jgi:N-acetylglucosaminyl-diphospho-decaprenol L-rhamnosyltransferase
MTSTTSMTRAQEAELSVVIVNYNTGDYLKRCLRSLESHRGAIEVDVLVIDNASHDFSHLAAKAEYPWVRLVANPDNRYLSPAWNQGVRETTAPFLLFLNPDAEWWSGTLADFVSVAREHPKAGMVGPMIRNMDGTVYPSGRPFPNVLDATGHAFLGPFVPRNRFTRRYHVDGWDRTTESEVDWVSGACILMPRAAFDEVGGFDESFLLYGEELDLATRLRALGWTVVFTPEVEVLHEIGVSTGRTHASIRMHSDSIYRYYRKHRASGWRRALLPLAWGALRARAEIVWLAESWRSHERGRSHRR